jgi:uncharacterized protein YbgA (DUF1722 family)/uncharacterized protein YbbK (DUF523 family)
MESRESLRPRVVISKCIEHGYCRYDGSQAKSPFVKELDKYIDIITVCPEVEIGLPVPREAIRIIKDQNQYKLISSRSGLDVSKKMDEFADGFKKRYALENIHGFILKSRSPSCGVKDVKVYKTIGKSASMGEKTSGFFGGAILDFFESIAIEDEGRLTNYNIREHFLTRIYTMAAYDKVLEKQSMKVLIEFHSSHKYLLMAYHQKYQKILGKIVANHEKKAIDEVIKDYLFILKKALAKPLRRGANINMLMHLFGYFKRELSKDEKAYFLDILEQYSDKKVPFSVPLSIIYTWVIRFQEPYLIDQIIFRPYPKGMLDVTDSGKGID